MNATHVKPTIVSEPYGQPGPTHVEDPPRSLLACGGLSSCVARGSPRWTRGISNPSSIINTYSGLQIGCVGMFLSYCYDSTELEAIHGWVAHRVPPPLSVTVTAGIKHLTLPYLLHAKVSISILMDSQLT